MKRLRDVLRRALVPALALITAFILGAIFIVLTDYEHLQHLGTDPAAAIGGALGTLVEGYGALFAGAIGDPARILTAIQTGNPADIEAAIRPISETLLSATPFVFVGLGLVVSFRAGLFNLGADGQFLMGGVGASITAAVLAGLQLPPAVVLVGGLLGGTIAGAAYGFVPGFLKARTGASEVITTLMLSIAAGDLAFLIFGWVGLVFGGIFSGPPAPIPAVPRIIDLPTIRVDYGFVVALAMAVVVSFVLFRTTRGFEIRATGFSPTVVRGAGIRPGRTTMLAMTLSGGLVGMGSAFFGLGPAGGFGGAPVRDLGFVALAIALVAGLRPTGVVLVSLLYGAMTTGAQQMGIVTGIPLALLVVIITFAMLFVAAPSLVRSIWRLKAPEAEQDTTSRTSVGMADST